MKKDSKKVLSFTIMFLVVALIGSNILWYHMLNKEQEKVKHAIIPSLSNDYYSSQIALTQNAKNYFDEVYEMDRKEYVESEGWLLYQNEVPLVLQNPDFPNGCEAAAAVMLLNYWGIDITLQEFVEKYLLQETVYEENGVRYGPNPASYYAGNPKDEKRGWGCFEPVIANAIQNVLNVYQKEDKATENYILRGENKYPLSMYLYYYKEPVMIWTTINYEEVSEVYEWFSYDKKNTYTYPKNSHAIVVTGMDENYYYINDPLKETKNIPVEKAKLEKSFDSLGRQVIGIQIYHFEDMVEEMSD